MEPIVIDDPADPRVEVFGAVRDPVLLRERGMFVAEGRRVVQALLDQPRFEVAAMLVTEQARSTLDLGRLDPAVPVYLVSKAVLFEIVRFKLHQGALAAAVRPADPPLSDVTREARRLVLLEGLTDPDNVGVVFRNALAFDVDAVLVSPRCCDPLYRKSIRTSMGAVLHLPFTRVPDWPAAIAWLREAGFVTVGLTPNPPATPLRRVCEAGLPARLALVLGTEGDGLRPATCEDVDRLVRIEMSPRADSINVAAASAIALHAVWETGATGSRPA